MDLDGGIQNINTQLCGVSMYNVCGPCTNSAQCQGQLGVGFICNPPTGDCVLNGCDNPGQPCAANPDDVCCAFPGGPGAGAACFTGNCCTNSDCGDASKTCVNHMCT
jgi:hypothetical protein